MITGISHITFMVSDLERSSQFFINLFDAKEIYSSGELQFSLAKEKYFLINDLWVCLMEGETLLNPTYNHIAFQVSEEELSSYENKVRALNLTIRPPRPRLPGEGRSLYFYDYDNHLFEIHAGTLAERLQAYSVNHI